MKRPLRLAVAFATVMCLMGLGAQTGPLTPSAEDVDADVIVIMGDQLSDVAPGHAARASALATAQAPIMAELQGLQAKNLRAFKTINAVGARISKSEAAKLAADPRVKAVVADKVIRLKKPLRDISRNGLLAANAASASSGTTDTALCDTLEPEALQLTHTAFLDKNSPQAQEVLDGNGRKVTGVGVKVAFIADGIDPNVTGFTRPDGTSVFVDYQDFSGDPAGTPTAGGEAFGDASSIAAQDYPNGARLTFDITGYGGPPPESPCRIQIRGMAPGASLVGLKVFSNLGYTTTSNFVQAIEYAVLHGVDVINESVGYEYYPDNDDDPLSLANKAAVAAGVIVVVSTGDAGTNGTLASPATDPYVIAVGASTQYRLYAQVGYPGGAVTSGVGYVSDNVSSLSSGGFAERGARTVDVVAPGESGWALCAADTTLYIDCISLRNEPAPIQDFGGTSESAPLTSGEAALIIQAYRSTHHGAKPAPALVKTIIKSTAVDLMAPSSEQGAGLINSLAAVKMALAYRDDSGGRVSSAAGMSFSPNSAAFVAEANTPETASFTLTNQGNEAQQLTPVLERLGAPFAGDTTSLKLNPETDPQFTNFAGDKRSYIKHNFKVPSGAQHLDVELAYQNNINTVKAVYMALLNPSGRICNYSLPQSNGTGYARVEASNPPPGMWSVVIWTRVPGDPLSYSGPLQLSWSAERYVDFGSVHPKSVEVQPGQSMSFSAHFSMPSQPGDSAAAIRFAESSALQAEIPISMRTLVPIGATGGDFTGTLTGTNGRGSPNPLQTFQFDVPKGVDNMSVTLNTSDSGNLLSGELIDPNGMQVSVVGNLDSSGNSQYGMTLFHYNPQPGRWQFLLVQNVLVSGNQTSLPFTARIGFNSAQITAPKLPTASKLSAGGKPVVVPIQVVNTGAVTEAYFADARLMTPEPTKLSASAPPSSFCVAFSVLPGGCGFVTLPTQVTHAEFIAKSTVPISMDAYPFSGYFAVYTYAPDIYAQSIGKNEVGATLIEPEVPNGVWVVDPSLIGPYGSAGAFKAPLSMGADVLMLPFDAAASADSGDIWADLVRGTNTFKPLVLAPGQAGVINLTVTPSKQQVGQLVRGAVFIDTYNSTVGTGDEVVRLPYSYTVTP